MANDIRTPSHLPWELRNHPRQILERQTVRVSLASARDQMDIIKIYKVHTKASKNIFLLLSPTPT